MRRRSSLLKPKGAGNGRWADGTRSMDKVRRNNKRIADSLASRNDFFQFSVKHSCHLFASDRSAEKRRNSNVPGEGGWQKHSNCVIHLVANSFSGPRFSDDKLCGRMTASFSVRPSRSLRSVLRCNFFPQFILLFSVHIYDSEPFYFILINLLCTFDGFSLLKRRKKCIRNQNA